MFCKTLLGERGRQKGWELASGLGGPMDQKGFLQAEGGIEGSTFKPLGEAEHKAISLQYQAVQKLLFFSNWLKQTNPECLQLLSRFPMLGLTNISF